MVSQVNVDARTALGVRPGARPRPAIAPLHLDGLSHGASTLPMGAALPTSTQQYGSPSSDLKPIISLSLPPNDRTTSASTWQTAASKAEPLKRRRATLARKNQAGGMAGNQNLLESQKLLSLLLDRLEARKTAPDILDRAALAARQSTGHVRHKSKPRVAQIGEAVAAVAHSRAGKGHASAGSTSSLNGDDLGVAYNEGDWDTDATYDLVEQVRDVLIIAGKSGLELFSTCQATAVEAARSAVQNKRKGSRFSSAMAPLNKSISNETEISQGPATLSGPELLSRLAQNLTILVAVDCMHRTQNFRLLHPPNGLQVMCLDVATILYHNGDMKIKLAAVDAVIEGLYTMGDSMKDRLCEWLEGRIDELLRHLAKERGNAEDKVAVEWTDPFSPTSPSPSVPTFAFSVDPGDAIGRHAPQNNDTKGWMRVSPITDPNSPRPWDNEISGILSTHSTTGSVSKLSLQIAAVVPRLLVAITSTVDLANASLTTIYRIHRLLSLLLTTKPDAALDLLEIVGHGPGITRKRSVDLLSTFYPQAMGHNIIARRPALATYQTFRAKWETGTDRVLLEDDSAGHYYIPWRCQDSTVQPCGGCNMLCEGFCAMCTLCGGTHHIECLRLLEDEVVQYDVRNPVTPAAGQPDPRVVLVKYSKCIPRLDEKMLDGGATRGTSKATTRKVGQHLFHLVNLFTLTLCGACRGPLWGATAQAYVCQGQCQRFYHPDCVQTMSERGNTVCMPGREVYLNSLTTSKDLDPFATTSEDVAASYENCTSNVTLDASQLAKMTYDEVSVIYADLWMQLEIYKNGLACGALRYTESSAADKDWTGLTTILKAYEEQLSVKADAQSIALTDFAKLSNDPVPAGCVLWRPRYLQYCSALLRAPSDPSFEQPALQVPPSPTTGFLTVEGLSTNPFVVDPPSMAYEAVDMLTLKRGLANDLSVSDPLAASIIVEQMRHLGLCSVPNCLFISPRSMVDKKLTVTFPVPLLMDASPGVEFLVSSIEQLLDEIDLTANEQALSLLYNRAWPSSVCSQYAMERLGGAIMSWIMDEDDVLHHIVKNFGSKQKRPPGVRHAPGSTSAAKGTTAVANYKEDRLRLLRHYAHPWLKALHDLDPDIYVGLAYERSKLMDNRYEIADLAKGEEAAATQIANSALERITSFADADAVFTSSLDLLTAWLEDLGSLARNDVAYKSLARLMKYTSPTAQDRDLWELARVTSEEGPEGLQRVCRWLRVLTFSGVEVPWEVVTAMIDMAAAGDPPEDIKFDLVSTVSTNLAPIAADAFASLCNQILIHTATTLGAKAAHCSLSDRETEILRSSMMAVLRAYGTSSEDIALTTLHQDSTAKKYVPTQALKRRQMANTLQRMVALDSTAVIAAANILQHPDISSAMVEMVLDFLWLLFAKSTAVDNVVDFLHKISPTLFAVLWPLYDRTVDRRSRARVFLKLLTVHAAPIEVLIHKENDVKGPSSSRERLLTFVLELSDDHVTSEVSGWRRASVGLIMLFFQGIDQATDPSPENLVAWRALMPSQLQAVSRCFEEYLISSSDEQRLHVLAGLQHLRMQLPTWPVVGWSVIEQLVTEAVMNIETLEKIDSDHAYTALMDTRAVRASVLSLGLYMLAAGVTCEWALVQRFQQHVAAACALPWPNPSDTITGIMLPALKEVLDSQARISPKSTILSKPGQLQVEGSRQETTIVGSLFVPVVINFSNELNKYDYVTQRYILDMMLVIFFKHNILPIELSALSALQTLGLFAAQSTCSDNRILALHVLQTAQTHVGKDRFTRVLPQLFMLVSDLMVAEAKIKGDPGVIDSCRTLLQVAIAEFGKAGLFLQVMRVDAQPSERKRDPQAIGRAMQMASRDGAEKSRGWLHQLILDLPVTLRWGRRQIGLVLQSFSHLTDTLDQELPEEASLDFSDFLTRLTKQAHEWDAPTDFDPNPVLQACRAILKVSPPGVPAKTLMDQIRHFLHIGLQRFNVNSQTIASLTATASKISTEQEMENSVATAMFEVSGSALNSGQPVTPSTLLALLSFLVQSDKESRIQGGNQASRLAFLNDAAVGSVGVLLRSHFTVAHERSDVDTTLNILNSAAQVIVRLAVDDPGNLGRILLSLPSQTAITQMDVFAHILYASLDVSLRSSRVDLVALYPILARATSLAMFACADLLSVTETSDGAHLAELIFIVVRLVILAVDDNDTPDDAPWRESTHEGAAAFLRRVWPDWERLLLLSISGSCINTQLRGVTLSVLLDIVIFIASNSPVLLVEPAPLIGRNLQMLGEWHTQTKTPHKQLPKAIAALESVTARTAPEAVLQKTNRQAATQSIWKQMLVAERLLSLRVADEADRVRERAPTRHAYR